MRYRRNTRQMTMFEEAPAIARKSQSSAGDPMSTITTVDLFAGAGGLSLGFHLADLGFMPVFAVEHESAAADTFARNFGCDVYAGDIEDGPEYPDTVDVIVGGPPCQGFSPLGRDRDEDSRARLNGLWKHYLDAVRTLHPKAFVIENVPEFQKSAQFLELLDLLETDTELRAYTPAFGVLNAADYGVPQKRRRGILVAVGSDRAGDSRDSRHRSSGFGWPKSRCDPGGGSPRAARRRASHSGRDEELGRWARRANQQVPAVRPPRSGRRAGEKRPNATGRARAGLHDPA